MAIPPKSLKKIHACEVSSCKWKRFKKTCRSEDMFEIDRRRFQTKRTTTVKGAFGPLICLMDVLRDRSNGHNCRNQVSTEEFWTMVDRSLASKRSNG